MRKFVVRWGGGALPGGGGTLPHVTLVQRVGRESRNGTSV